VFLVKIGNLHSSHGQFQSWADFVSESGSTFVPRITHAFLKFQDFPPNYAQFHRRLVSILELPRESVIYIMMFEDYFSSIHALDRTRYAALKAILEVRGRPKKIERRKIYALCDLDQIERFCYWSYFMNQT